MRLIAVLALLGIGTCVAQDSAAPPTRHTNEYLFALTETEKNVFEAEQELKAQPSSDPQALSIKQRNLTGVLQAFAVVRSTAGDAQGAIAAFGQMWRYREQFNGVKSVGDEQADLLAIESSHAVDAVEAIARAAHSRQVVILNEAHHVPFDRILAMRLARVLRKEGFEYLACETFFIDDEHVLDRGYVVEKTGVYSREPTFAKFLMDAQKDGWKFVSYEPSGDLRESGMAKNLMKRIFAADPKAKALSMLAMDTQRSCPFHTVMTTIPN